MILIAALVLLEPCDDRCCALACEGSAVLRPRRAGSAAKRNGRHAKRRQQKLVEAECHAVVATPKYKTATLPKAKPVKASRRSSLRTRLRRSQKKKQSAPVP